MSLNSPRSGKLARVLERVRGTRRVQTVVQDVNAPYKIGADGQLIFQATEDTTISVFQFVDTSGNVLGTLQFYNVGGTVLASLEGASPDTSTIGSAQLLGGRVNRDKYAYIQVSSNGLAVVNLTSSSDITNSATRLEVQGRSSDSGAANTVIAANLVSSGGSHSAGFGAQVYLQADGSYQGALKGRFTGAGTTADTYIDAPNKFKVSQGSPPALVGSWGGNAAGAALSALLATMGLLTDNSTP